jgi:lipid A 3-O-deacylase
MKKIALLFLAVAFVNRVESAPTLDTDRNPDSGSTNAAILRTRSAITLDAVAVGLGQSRDNIGIYRLGLRSDFKRSWLDGNLTGFFEASANCWRKHGDGAFGVALSPVFVLQPRLGLGEWHPYVDGGIGVACISKTMIAGRDMSSLFQFEDRVGVGVKWRRFDLNVGYLHYSNANQVLPNQGIDIFIATGTCSF